MAGVLQHLRSSTLDKRPNPASMVDGQVAINYASGSPGMFFKDSNGDLVKVGPVHVGTTAPNVSPASGGTAGNSKGEQWLDTTGGTYVFKVWDGSAWRSETGTFVDVNGDTMTGALGIIAGSASTPGLFFSGDTNTGIYSPGADQLALSTNGTGRLFVDAIGRVGVGTASPSAMMHVQRTDTANNYVFVESVSAGNAGLQLKNNSGTYTIIANADLRFRDEVAGTDRLRIDSSGRLLVGTSSSPSAGTGQYALAVVQGYAGGATGEGILSIARGKAATSMVNTDTVGQIVFTDNAGNTFAKIISLVDGTVSSTSDLPGALAFSTTADGASSPTERMRITNGGNVTIGSDATTALFNQTSVTGAVIERAGAIQLARSGDQSLLINRISNDGALVGFYQDATQEGTISVSGTTVSYNGAHLSRWSQLPSGVERTEILRGTVLSNIDEMCEWGDEDNEQLNRMKVSDVEGDKNVSGVFQAWDDDDDTYTNDFYCAMTGDFIIRIGAGVMIERGDLLMSAGDGTAKPQDDDIIRSKTIAKVTSTNVSCTYPDGSYCVPCVLMAC